MPFELTVILMLAVYIIARSLAGATEFEGEVSAIGRFAWLVCIVLTALIVGAALLHPVG